MEFKLFASRTGTTKAGHANAILNKSLKHTPTLLIIYKILHDSLFLLLLFLLLAVASESFLPGIITFHFRLYKVFLLISVNLMAIYFITATVAEKINAPKVFLWQNKKTLLALFFLSFIILFNLHFKLNIFLAIVLIASIYATGYLIYRVLFEE